ncbi:hypothetical protein [Pseudoalteromonas sp. NBT06-2]|nr:hypothetical protein [Pseudoalteromonas sp. NBT06-2]
MDNFKDKKIVDKKDIAESNKDHEAALELNTLEFKVKRWTQFNVAKSNY